MLENSVGKPLKQSRTSPISGSTALIFPPRERQLGSFHTNTSQSSWKSSPHRSLLSDQRDGFFSCLKVGITTAWRQLYSRQVMSFLKGNVPVSGWTLFCIFLSPSLAVICCSLLWRSRWHRSIHVQQFSPVPFWVNLPSTSDLMLPMGIYSFFSRTLFNPFFFSSLAAWHTLPQQPLHRSFINDSYELSVFEQERFTFDWYLASSYFMQQRSNSFLLWQKP